MIEFAVKFERQRVREHYNESVDHESQNSQISAPDRFRHLFTARRGAGRFEETDMHLAATNY